MKEAAKKTKKKKIIRNKSSSVQLTDMNDN